MRSNKKILTGIGVFATAAAALGWGFYSYKSHFLLPAILACCALALFAYAVRSAERREASDMRNPIAAYKREYRTEQKVKIARQWLDKQERRDRLALGDFVRMVLPSLWFYCVVRNSSYSFLRAALRYVIGFAFLALLNWIWSRVQSARWRVWRPRESEGQDVNFAIKMAIFMTACFMFPLPKEQSLGETICVWLIAMVYAGGATYLVGERKIWRFMQFVFAGLFCTWGVGIVYGVWRFGGMCLNGSIRHYVWRSLDTYLAVLYVLSGIVLWSIWRSFPPEWGGSDGGGWRDIPDVPFPNGPVLGLESEKGKEADAVVVGSIGGSDTRHSLRRMGKGQITEAAH